MNKEFICKGCGEKFNKDMQSSNVGYCYICNEFYMRKQISDLEAKLAESEKPKEIRFNGFVVDCNYDEARKVLQEDILKMQAENKKLKESEELNNYAKCILENKKLEEDLELSERCCVEYEEEIKQLKQQLAKKEEKLEEKTDALKELRQKCFEEQKEHLQETAGLYRELAEHNQDKISFAVEQLDKVKEIINTYNKEHCFLSTEIDTCNNSVEIIDNQIKQLKEGK